MNVTILAQLAARGHRAIGIESPVPSDSCRRGRRRESVGFPTSEWQSWNRELTAGSPGRCSMILSLRFVQRPAPGVFESRIASREHRIGDHGDRLGRRLRSVRDSDAEPQKPKPTEDSQVRDSTNERSIWPRRQQRRERHVLQSTVRNHYQSLVSQLGRRGREYHSAQVARCRLEIPCLAWSIRVLRCAGVSSDFVTLRAVSDS